MFTSLTKRGREEAVEFAAVMKRRTKIRKRGGPYLPQRKAGDNLFIHSRFI
jgi:hypothetical protein